MSFCEPRGRTVARGLLSLLGLLCAGVSATEAAGPAEELKDTADAPVARRLTTDGLFKRDPAFAPVSGEDGGDAWELVWSVQEDSRRLVLVRRGDGGEPERLHPEAGLPEFAPRFPREGNAYVFLQSRGNQNITLVLRHRGKSETEHLDGKARNPDLFPGGRRAVFSQPGDGGQRLVVLDLESDERRVLAPSEHFDNWPSVAPDGRSIVFASTRGGPDLDLWVIGVDGEDLHRLTESPGRDFRPAWSPDGRWIAYTSARGGDTDIRLVRPNGSGDRPLTRHPGRDDWPAWTPDGEAVVFVGERKGAYDLWRIPVDAPPSSEAESPASGAEAPATPPGDTGTP